MSFLRPTILRSAPFRSVLSIARQARIQTRFASQDYGSGAGDPVGEKPQEQGKSKATENIEHPGPPPPPNVGKSKSPSSNEQSSQSQSSGRSEGKSGGGVRGSNKEVKGSQPKILNESPPGKYDEGVRQHNEEMDQRAERAHEQISNEDAQKGKVPPGFWAGGLQLNDY
ncbi:uncharacterized protein BDR25DRAFT_129351 [Lindgomyces ingoldianus]|uniref:Uncharacterized protein n=1 Tax=Lindgomyces ingoldianus TaxID=673940 RepID=A0ACB6R411_9PLEO|nr:uncharacterized protein BDR25DRAFT_129351 [Lindgomyces ingoldianus]KAF2473166.1 hypothetical protein BDR25DRAFT_129351 [Lindgomyces ingoldianus]